MQTIMPILVGTQAPSAKCQVQSALIANARRRTAQSSIYRPAVSVFQKSNAMRGDGAGMESWGARTEESPSSIIMIARSVETAGSPSMHRYRYSLAGGRGPNGGEEMELGCGEGRLGANLGFFR